LLSGAYLIALAKMIDLRTMAEYTERISQGSSTQTNARISMKKLLFYFWVIIPICFQLVAADQAQTTWVQLVDQNLAAIEEHAHLKESLREELYSWDPESSIMTQGIKALIGDPLLLRCIGSQILPVCCHLGLNYLCGIESVDFAGSNFSIYEFSSIALHLLSSVIDKGEAFRRARSDKSEELATALYAERSAKYHRYTCFQSLGAHSLPVLLPGSFIAASAKPILHALQAYHTGFLLFFRQKQMNNEAWLVYVLKILEIKYSLMGNPSQLILINFLIDRDF
jgi:hypothetical protein